MSHEAAQDELEMDISEELGRYAKYVDVLALLRFWLNWNKCQSICIVYEHEILCQNDSYFLNGSHFSLMIACPAYMIDLRAFIFQTSVH